MKAMVFEGQGVPLVWRERARPIPGAGQVLVRVRACGVCRTDLHIVDGELANPRIPLILGHEIVGTVAEMGDGVQNLEIGQRIGVPWLGRTCGSCTQCVSGRENLCDDAAFTGYQLDGGYAEYTVADAHFCFPIPDGYPDANAAPLLCAGLIGYRSYRMASDGINQGLYGFGAAAHIIAQVAITEGKNIYAFTRPGDRIAQEFALDLGAVWAGGSDQTPPVELDSAIIFAPVGSLVPAALKAVRKGGTVVCAGIHMSDIPAFPYADLWGERIVRSVANLTREDGYGFFTQAGRIPIHTEVETMPLQEANQALDRLRTGDVTGALVLIPPNI